MALETWLAFFVASWLISALARRRRDLLHERGPALRIPSRGLEHRSG